ncbi:MAG: glycosyltransferase, partial [Myxococcota bacterium]
GAQVTAFTYGTGDGRAPDLELRRAPVWTSPRRLASGFSARKPLADLALAQRLLAAHRELPFEAVLAHNAEAALAGFAARACGGPPVVYVAHTLWEHELESHLPGPAGARRKRPKRPGAARLGARLDRLCARRADAVVVLTEATQLALAPHATGPVACIPPGWRPEPSPRPEEVLRACTKAGLEPDRFVAYAGNLDRYQGLDLLDAAAVALPDLPCVVVTHAEPPARFRALRTVRVASPREMRALVFGAASIAIPRRIVGGFPLKLIDAMDAKRAIVGHPAGLGDLRHAESAWCLPPEAGATEWASSLASLQGDPALRGRLGAGARAVLETEHAWPKLADRTLQLVASLR